jgi:hypothetical protein
VVGNFLDFQSHSHLFTFFNLAYKGKKKIEKILSPSSFPLSSNVEHQREKVHFSIFYLEMTTGKRKKVDHVSLLPLSQNPHARAIVIVCFAEWWALHEMCNYLYGPKNGSKELGTTPHSLCESRGQAYLWNSSLRPASRNGSGESPKRETNYFRRRAAEWKD